MEIAAKAIELKSAGVDLIDLSVGEPDFPTPQHIKEAAKNALDNNCTKYTKNKGTNELRTAIAAKLERENNLHYTTEQIIVSTGAKQALFNAVQTIVDKGEEVIIPTPSYVSYIQMVKFAEGKVIKVDADETNRFKIHVNSLKKAITKNTKLLLLCNPCNPTGAFYDKDELKEIARLVLENNIFVICDEIYEKLLYDRIEFCSFASLNEDIKKQTVVVNGFSKAYSMTGWRIGYAAAEQNIIDNMAKLQSHSTSCASSVSQAAALAALTSLQDSVEEMRIGFEYRRNFAFDSLTQIKGLSVVKPSGAFYIFPNVKSFFGKSFQNYAVKNSHDLALYLLNEAKVTVVPGSGFKCEGYIRLSFANSIENLNEGVLRIAKALNKLK